MKFLKKEQGQSLIEVVVALSVASIVITSLLIVVINSLKNAQFAQTQVRATKLASQAIEQIRAVRDRDGLVTFSSASGVTKFSDLWLINMNNACSPNPCAFKVNTDLSLVQTNQAADTEALGDGLSREVVISDSNDSHQTEKTVTVKVRWTDSSGTHESNLQTIMGKDGI